LAGPHYSNPETPAPEAGRQAQYFGQVEVAEPMIHGSKTSVLVVDASTTPRRQKCRTENDGRSLLRVTGAVAADLELPNAAAANF
jgi:hypothetical protein